MTMVEQQQLAETVATQKPQHPLDPDAETEEAGFGPVPAGAKYVTARQYVHLQRAGDLVVPAGQLGGDEEEAADVHDPLFHLVATYVSLVRTTASALVAAGGEDL